MAIYEYFSEKLQEPFEMEYALGKAPAKAKHPETGEKCERYYGSMEFVLKGPGWTGRSKKMNRDMTKRNDAAGHRMRKEHDNPKIVAHDYGNGDIREVKK